MTASPLSTLLLLTTVATIMSAATSSASASASSPALPPAPRAMLEPNELFLFTPPGDIREVEKCWASIVKVEECAADLLISFANLHVSIARDCCEAVVSIGEECFVAVFTNFPFSPLFPPLLKSFCNAIFANGRHCNKISPPPVA